jgi:hypothetical protein
MKLMARCVCVCEYHPQTEKCPLEEMVQSGVDYPFTNRPICVLFVRDRQ